METPTSMWFSQQDKGMTRSCEQKVYLRGQGTKYSQKVRIASSVLIPATLACCKTRAILVQLTCMQRWAVILWSR